MMTRVKQIHALLAFTAVLAGFVLSIPVTAQAVQYNEPSHRPKFSWDTVPLYAHFGDREGMSDEEVEFIALHYDFIVLEKAHGMAKYAYTEQGTIEDVARIKAVNPQAKMLYYWNLLLDHPLYEASARREDHPSWFIHGLDG
jgi:hypothetical protein